MKSQKHTLRDYILVQLNQYTYSKNQLEEWEKFGLSARKLEQSAKGSRPGDPTAAQALSHLEPDERIRRIRGWVNAIEQAYEFFLLENQTKAKLMEMLYGLDGKPAHLCTQYNREEISQQLNIGNSTLYNWRHDIVTMVLMNAVEEGLLTPQSRKTKRH
ncbi:hypothetical protein LJC42_06385 [Eubacteriales bacterium OttesenSCG-928-K08]|nr:hypothetical protein [Eubacteriales bacterium OttesenSCG-928-K08]